MISDSFTFEDILIQPHNHSRVKSRSTVDTSVEIGGVKLDMPVISASMSLFDTYSPFSEKEETPYISFATAIAEAGGMHIFSRATYFWPRVMAANVVASSGLNVGAAVSLQEFLENQDMLENQNFVVSIDIANGAIIDDIDWRGEKPLIVGNFGNPSIGMTDRFKGNVILKLGIGSGNACSTRLVTGVGAPQAGLVYETARNTNFPLISDGGINTIGDFVKAIALGQIL
jgi:GMP reductase